MDWNGNSSVSLTFSPEAVTGLRDYLMKRHLDVVRQADNAADNLALIVSRALKDEADSVMVLREHLEKRS